MSDFEFKVTRDGALAHVDLNRPEEGNALTRAMWSELGEAIKELKATRQQMHTRGRQPAADSCEWHDS